MSDAILQAVQVIAPEGVVEVRALAESAVHSGYFDDRSELAARAEVLDADPEVAGIYVTLNPVNPALLARRANRIKMRLGKKDATTSDADIVKRRWLPVDIDPVRPSGVSSTDDEHDLALATAGRIAAWLGEQGFPAPVKADSGNGAHLLYRIDLSNDEAATGLVKGCLATLDALFSNEQVTVDTANYNAARIWKLYGTVSRKGDNTAERPHRRARLLAVPDELAVVPAERLTHLAGLLPKDEPPAPKKGGGDRPRRLAARPQDRRPVGETLPGRDALHPRGLPVLGGAQGRSVRDPVRERRDLRRVPPPEPAAAARSVGRSSGQVTRSGRRNRRRKSGRRLPHPLQNRHRPMTSTGRRRSPSCRTATRSRSSSRPSVKSTSAMPQWRSASSCR